MRYIEGEFIESPEVIVSESFLELWLDDMQLTKFTCSPGHEEQLGIGHLMTSGLISRMEEIEIVSCESNQLIFTSKKKADLVRRFLQLQTGDSAFPYHLESIEDLSIQVSDLRQLVKELLSNQGLHDRTGGAHGALIYDIDTDRHFIVEDVGRFNAVDKAVGLAMQKGFDLGRSLLLVTGRLTSEMVSKAVRTRIPVMGSLAIATDMGIHLAMNAHVTLLGRLKDSNFWLYNQGHVKMLT